ncbi:MAG TPA: transposase [Phycisphaerae bacterium]|nr:transposase [Phycisphaerae bacterium]
MATQPDRPIPLAYLITFTCYGTWLHGDERGSADDDHRMPGTPYLVPDAGRRDLAARVMREPPYQLDEAKRCCVLAAIREVCEVRAWRLLAAHVRPNHVHAVVTGAEVSERIMNALKAYASRRLNQGRFDDDGCKRWTRHGSTRYLWNEAAVEQAVAYVVDEQGEPAAVYDVRRDGGTAPSRSRLG